MKTKKHPRGCFFVYRQSDREAAVHAKALTRDEAGFVGEEETRGGEYVLGAPQLPRVTFAVGDGRTFTVIAKNLSRKNLYVKSVALNGRPLAGFVLRHADVVAGGELVFDMTDKPSAPNF